MDTQIFQNSAVSVAHNSLDEQQIAIGYQQLTGLLRRSVTGCILKLSCGK